MESVARTVLLLIICNFCVCVFRLAQSQRETLANNIDNLLFDPDESAYSGDMSSSSRDDVELRMETYEERRRRARERASLTSSWDDDEDEVATSSEATQKASKKAAGKSPTSLPRDPEDEHLSPDDPESDFKTLAQFDEDDPFGEESNNDSSTSVKSDSGRELLDNGESSAQKRSYI